MNLSYTKIGNYLLPNLTIKNKSYGEINKYSYLRLHYLKENNKALYTTLLMQNKLTNHLVLVGNEAENKLNILMKIYQSSDEKLSEKNKELNQLEWVKLMNNYNSSAEEIILKELIYV